VWDNLSKRCKSNSDWANTFARDEFFGRSRFYQLNFRFPGQSGPSDGSKNDIFRGRFRPISGRSSCVAAMRFRKGRFTA